MLLCEEPTTCESEEAVCELWSLSVEKSVFFMVKTETAKVSKRYPNAN